MQSRWIWTPAKKYNNMCLCVRKSKRQQCLLTLPKNLGLSRPSLKSHSSPPSRSSKAVDPRGPVHLAHFLRKTHSSARAPARALVLTGQDTKTTCEPSRVHSHRPGRPGPMEDDFPLPTRGFQVPC